MDIRHRRLAFALLGLVATVATCIALSAAIIIGWRFGADHYVASTSGDQHGSNMAAPLFYIAYGAAGAMGSILILAAGASALGLSAVLIRRRYRSAPAKFK